MNVLLTGAFGNVGQNTLKNLLKQGHVVTCFDIKNSQNEKACQKLQNKGDFEVIWGDITNPEDLTMVVGNVDTIIHLAAIIPPLSEKIPELAYKVNVIGSQNLIEAAKKLEKLPRFILASSVSIYGSTMSNDPPVKADDPVCPSDHYSHTKVEVEKMLKESGLPYLILRLGAVSIPKVPHRLDPVMFEVPLDNRIEFVDSRDCGIAFANSVNINSINKVLLIGGGPECQMYQRDFIKGMFGALGLKMLPDSAFRVAKKDDEWFYTDWMDTSESQKLLNYQQHTFKDYLQRLSDKVSLRRFGLRMVGPFAKFALLLMSPYYKFSKGDTIEFTLEDYRHLKSLFDENANTIDLLTEKISSLEHRIEVLEK